MIKFQSKIKYNYKIIYKNKLIMEPFTNNFKIIFKILKFCDFKIKKKERKVNQVLRSIARRCWK